MPLQNIINGSACKVTIFTSSGTWNKDIRTKAIYVRIWTGGSGGGSGMRGATSTLRIGGGGGIGGFLQGYFVLDNFSSSESITIGAGGSGGAAQTSNNMNGNNGALGGTSSVGSNLIATPLDNSIGQGGVSGRGIASSWAATASAFFAASGSADTSIQNTQAVLCDISTMGGFAGNITAMNALTAATIGVPIVDLGGNILISGGTLGSSPGGNGGNGNNRNTSGTVIVYGATGGGGGASSDSGTAGTGGNGGYPSGGGGGGGGSLNGNNSGAGGNGADGQIIILEFF